MNGRIDLEDFGRLQTARADYPGPQAGILSLPARLWSRMLRAYRTRRAMAALEALDDGMLKDIGVSRSEIERVVGDGTSRELMRLQSLASCRRQLSRVGTSTCGGTADLVSRSSTKKNAVITSAPIDLASIRKDRDALEDGVDEDCGTEITIALWPQ